MGDHTVEFSPPAWDVQHNKLIYPIAPPYQHFFAGNSIINHLLPHTKREDRGRVYICPQCDKPLIPNRGTVRRWHFCHFPGSGCSYLDKMFREGGESFDHRFAKTVLYGALKQRRPVTILGAKCATGHCPTLNDTFSIQYLADDQVVMERELMPKCRPDISILNNGHVRYIFEIYHTSRTLSERPDPWFEISAREILEKDRNGVLRDLDAIMLRDMKHYICGHCPEAPITRAIFAAPSCPPGKDLVEDAAITPSSSTNSGQGKTANLMARQLRAVLSRQRQARKEQALMMSTRIVTAAPSAPIPPPSRGYSESSSSTIPDPDENADLVALQVALQVRAILSRQHPESSSSVDSNPDDNADQVALQMRALLSNQHLERKEAARTVIVSASATSPSSIPSQTRPRTVNVLAAPALPSLIPSQPRARPKSSSSRNSDPEHELLSRQCEMQQKTLDRICSQSSDLRALYFHMELNTVITNVITSLIEDKPQNRNIIYYRTARAMIMHTIDHDEAAPLLPLLIGDPNIIATVIRMDMVAAASRRGLLDEFHRVINFWKNQLWIEYLIASDLPTGSYDLIKIISEADDVDLLGLAISYGYQLKNTLLATALKFHRNGSVEVLLCHRCPVNDNCILEFLNSWNDLNLLNKLLEHCPPGINYPKYLHCAIQQQQDNLIPYLRDRLIQQGWREEFFEYFDDIELAQALYQRHGVIPADVCANVVKYRRRKLLNYFMDSGPFRFAPTAVHSAPGVNYPKYLHCAIQDQQENLIPNLRDQIIQQGWSREFFEYFDDAELAQAIYQRHGVIPADVCANAIKYRRLKILNYFLDSGPFHFALVARAPNIISNSLAGSMYSYPKLDSTFLEVLRHYDQNPKIISDVQTLVLSCDNQFVVEGPYSLRLVSQVRSWDSMEVVWDTNIRIDSNLNRLKAALLYFSQIPNVTSIKALEPVTTVAKSIPKDQGQIAPQQSPYRPDRAVATGVWQNRKWKKSKWRNSKWRNSKCGHRRYDSDSDSD